MPEEKFLVIGGQGLIGQGVIQELDRKFQWVGTYYSRALEGYRYCNVLDLEGLKESFGEAKPTHVIHCAGLAGGVDFCEREPRLAKRFYVEGAKNVGRLCEQFRAKLISISSECVFGGEKESYTEEDSFNPLNVYGACKAEADSWIEKNVSGYAIVRTMSVFGWQPDTVTPNAVMSMYFSLKKGEKVFIPVYRWGTPTYIGDLAKAISEVSLSPETGTFHIVGESYINRYEWLKKTGEKLGWNSPLILPQSELAKNLAKRPSKVKLDTAKFRSRFRTRLHGLTEALEMLRRDMNRSLSEAGRAVVRA